MFSRRSTRDVSLTLSSATAFSAALFSVLLCVPAAASVLGGPAHGAAAPRAQQQGDVPPISDTSQPGPIERRANALTPENPIPRRLSSIPIPYPAGIVDQPPAIVLVRVTVDETGQVAEVRAINPGAPPPGLRIAAAAPGQALTPATPSPEYTALVRATVEGIRQWRYEPPAQAPIAFTLRLRFPAGGDAILSGADTMYEPPPGLVRTNVGQNPAAQHSTVAAWSSSHPDAVRVGGRIPPPVQIKRVAPVYPRDAHAARVQGTVVLEAVIDRDGRVAEARVLRSVPPLDAAAMDAVKQWEYARTLVNGQPVPVMMTVAVTFRLTP